MKVMIRYGIIGLWLAVGVSGGQAREPLPEKLVVLTFDDSAKSHYTVARPLLKELGFGATFFITEGWDFATNKVHYMTWEEIRMLHEDGFEIGNHTRDHMGVTPKTVSRLDEQLSAIEARCKDHGIPSPVTFAWPGNAITPDAFQILQQHGIQFARRGGAPEYPYKLGRGPAYEPGIDHPLLVPTAADARPFWQLDNFMELVKLVEPGKVTVLQFHGVPDVAHPWVSSKEDKFSSYMRWLKEHDYTVIALRDLAKYVDVKTHPEDPLAIIEQRKKEISRSEAQPQP
jgi:peptidoglycan/xylan/chitin deacetylase (PgdA/CDA1 family)